MEARLSFNGRLLFLLGILMTSQITLSTQTTSYNPNSAYGHGPSNPAHDNFVMQQLKDAMCRNARTNPNPDPYVMLMCTQHYAVAHNCTRLPPPSVTNLRKPVNLEDLVNTGSAKIQAYPNVDEAIFILGNTGAGKTTLAQILTGNLSRIHAVKTQSGSLVIVDDDDKIGAPSTVSKTLIPELIQLPNASMAFYDCPGFDDTRGSDQDIAANFFMNQIVKKVSSVKMLFLVIHSSVKHGNDRLDFDLLAGHASKFVKNLPKYRNSIGLVVTKVGSYSDFGEYRSEEDIMSEIIEFISTFNQTLHSRLSLESGVSSQIRSEITGKIHFVNILLQNPQSKISFLRTVEKCGPLEKSSAISRSKEIITSLFTNLEVTSAYPQDFGYALKDKTLLRLHQLTESKIAEISTSVEILVAHFRNWYERRNINLFDVPLLRENAQDDFVVLESLMNRTSEVISRNNSSPAELSQVLRTHLAKLGYALPYKFELFMEREQDYFDFFDEIISLPTRSRNVRDWLTPIQNLHPLLANQRDWFEFCANLQSSLYSYPVQKEKSNFAVPQLGQVEWLEFIDNNTIHPVSEHIRSIATGVGEQPLQVLENLMKFALDPIEVSCSGTNLTISGNLTLLSDIADERNHRLRWICSEGVLPTKLEVYASHSIFIDTDFRMVGDDLDVVLISPIWTVIGSRVVDLSGRTATEITPRTAEGGDTLVGNTGGPGGDGVEGRPGEHGGSGGSFFGVAGKINGGCALQIITSGGNGGNGQHGGNGGDGRQGRDPHKDELGCDRQELITCVKKSHPGFPGYSGGKGGNGGVGGVGGLPGELTLISLDLSTPPCVSRSSEMGKDGEPGEGGEGGKAGNASNAVSCSRSSSVATRWNCKSRPSQFRNAANGGSGEPNKNSRGRPEFTPPSHKIIEWRSMLSFKKTFFEREENAVRGFSELLENDSQFQKYYSARAYLAELMDLEEISLRDGIDIDSKKLDSSYKSYQNRVASHFGENAGNLSGDERKVLTLLLASASSKLLNLCQFRDLGVVTDLAHFLIYLKDQLDSLKSSTASEVVEEVTLAYKEKINEKMGQVKGFIRDVVEPALESAGMEVESKLASLGKQFEVMFVSAEVNLEKCSALLKREKESLVMKQVLNGILVTIQVLGVFDKTGIVSSVGLGASLVQGALEGDSSGVRQVADLSNTAFMTHQLLSSNQDKNQNRVLRGNIAAQYLGNGFATLFEKFGNDRRKVAHLEEVVQEAALIVGTVRERGDLLEKSFAPDVHSMMAHVDSIKTKMASGEPLEASALDMTKWLATKGFKDVKEKLQNLVSGIESLSKGLVKSIDAVQDALSMMLDLAGNIEEYRNSMNLAAYVGAVNSASLRSVQISDPELALGATKLEKFVRENVLRREYQVAVHAFKQWVFPFAKLQLSQFQNVAATASLGGDDESDSSSVYLAEINKLQAQLGRYQSTTLSARDEHIIKSNFHSGRSSTHPFFVWRNEEFGFEIGELLSGNKVHLKADARKSAGGRDAVKFSQIEINFKIGAAANRTFELKETLRDELEHFSVSMTHGGLSMYRFQGDIFLMTGPNQTLVYNFERDSRGHREGTNEIYNKFERGDFLLSPYTTWTIQLRKAVASYYFGFEKLQKFASLVDLELVGSGQYVNNDAELREDLEVDKYYVRDEISMREEMDF